MPRHAVVAGAQRHDAPLPAPARAGLERWNRPMLGTTVHLDAGYDSRGTLALLVDRQLTERIGCRGAPASVHSGRRRVMECSDTWLNPRGRLRRCPARHETLVTFSVTVAAAIGTTHDLLTAARTRDRWLTRPPAPRLKECLMPDALNRETSPHAMLHAGLP